MSRKIYKMHTTTRYSKYTMHYSRNKTNLCLINFNHIHKNFTFHKNLRSNYKQIYPKIENLIHESPNKLIITRTGTRYNYPRNFPKNLIIQHRSQHPS